MNNSLLLLLLLPAVLVLNSCQSAPPATTAAESAASPGPAAGTEAQARAAVARYVQALPNAARYQIDSASTVDVDTHWQVLVPRTDWAGRMPNRAAFEVDKRTGAVSTRAVK